MTASPGNNSYKASDIERYHNGQMSVEEKHALEKAALDDPFLADAIEGYSYTNTPMEDLRVLESRLKEKTRERKVVPLFFRHTKWMKAAVIILMVTGSIWLLTRNLTKENNAVALDNFEKQKTDSSIPSEESSKYLMTDSTNFGTAATDSAAPLIITPGLSSYNKIVSRKLKDSTNFYNYATVAPSNENLGNQEGYINKDQDATSRSDNDYKTERRRSTSEVTDMRSQNNSRNIEGLNNGAWMNNRNKQEQRAEFKNSSTYRENITPGVYIDSAAANVMAKNDKVIYGIKSDTIRNLNVVLKPQVSAPMQEVVVGSGKSKEAAQYDRMQRVVIDTLEPAEGMSHFDDYVAGNIKVPEELKLKPVSGGEVQLSFELNELGNPINITVVKSLCKECDEEAIRLLKEGPKWKKKRNKKGKITIKF